MWKRIADEMIIDTIARVLFLSLLHPHRNMDSDDGANTAKSLIQVAPNPKT